MYEKGADMPFISLTIKVITFSSGLLESLTAESSARLPEQQERDGLEGWAWNLTDLVEETLTVLPVQYWIAHGLNVLERTGIIDRRHLIMPVSYLPVAQEGSGTAVEARYLVRFTE